jgi:hypothetical protein
LVTVQAAISANTITGDQAICTGTSAATITGSVPAGGDGNYQFQWEMNTTGNTWTTIANAQTANYSPGILTATTRYRRLATTNLCAGSQASTSAIVTVIVNPDAVAAYTYAKLQDCAPFALTAQQMLRAIAITCGLRKVHKSAQALHSLAIPSVSQAQVSILN